MNAIDFSTRHVVFKESSPISGAFDIDKYRFLAKPLLSLDNIRVKQTTIYKAASSVGTVCGQIAMAYRLACRPGSMLFVCQTDDDAKDWMATRGRSWFESIDYLTSLLKEGRYSIKSDLLTWPHQWLMIHGPGVNNQNSRQVRYVHTDEAHLDAWKPGFMASFTTRMGLRWDRNEFHVSTASDESTVDGEGKPVSREIDVKYHEGQQDEWHLGCVHCHKLVWPLWEQYSVDHYNGHKVFQWKESQSHKETIESLVMICPYCGKETKDDPKIRYEMSMMGDYVAMNPGHDPKNESYRWSRFAPNWMRWDEILETYLKAVSIARSGSMKEMEEFTKKWLCMTWRGHIPDLMDAYVTGDYRLGDVWIP